MSKTPVWLCSECIYSKYLRATKIRGSGQARLVHDLQCGLHGIHVGAYSASCNRWIPRTLESMEQEFPKDVVDFAIDMSEYRRARRMTDRPKS